MKIIYFPIFLKTLAIANLLGFIATFPAKAADACQHTTEAQVVALEDAFLQSVTDGDVSFLEQHVDAAYIGTNTEGVIHDKTILIERRKAAGHEYPKVKMLQRSVRVLGDTAIIWEKVRLVSEADDGNGSRNMQLTRVWRLFEGHWKVVTFHATNLPEALSSD